MLESPNVQFSCLALLQSLIADGRLFAELSLSEALDPQIHREGNAWRYNDAETHAQIRLKWCIQKQAPVLDRCSTCRHPKHGTAEFHIKEAIRGQASLASLA